MPPALGADGRVGVAFMIAPEHPDHGSIWCQLQVGALSMAGSGVLPGPRGGGAWFLRPTQAQTEIPQVAIPSVHRGKRVLAHAEPAAPLFSAAGCLLVPTGTQVSKAAVPTPPRLDWRLSHGAPRSFLRSDEPQGPGLAFRPPLQPWPGRPARRGREGTRPSRLEPWPLEAHVPGAQPRLPHLPGPGERSDTALSAQRVTTATGTPFPSATTSVPASSQR